MIPHAIVAECVGGLDFECRAKLNCQLDSLHKQSRRSRRKANRHPCDPASLEDISIPHEYKTSLAEENMLLWDSTYSAERRRSFLFGTIDNVDMLATAEHLIIDGTFKTSPNLFTQLFTVHGVWDDGWRI